MNIEDFYYKYVIPNEYKVSNNAKKDLKFNSIIFKIFGFIIIAALLSNKLSKSDISLVYLIAIILAISVMFGIFIICYIIVFKLPKFDCIAFYEKDIFPIFFKKCFNNIEYFYEKKRIRFVLTEKDNYKCKNGIIYINLSKKIKIREKYWSVQQGYSSKIMHDLELKIPTQSNKYSSFFMTTLSKKSKFYDLSKQETFLDIVMENFFQISDEFNIDYEIRYENKEMTVLIKNFEIIKEELITKSAAQKSKEIFEDISSNIEVLNKICLRLLELEKYI